MEKRWCSACGAAFEPRAQTPRQAFCPKEACQSARKRLWQRAKRSTDDDYRKNQAAAQELWRRNHPDYWRKYREEHPDYAASNRKQQRARNARRNGGSNVIAKDDASESSIPHEGIFRLVLLVPLPKGPIRQWTVRLTRVSRT